MLQVRGNMSEALLCKLQAYSGVWIKVSSSDGQPVCWQQYWLTQLGSSRSFALQGKRCMPGSSCRSDAYSNGALAEAQGLSSAGLEQVARLGYSQPQ